MSRRGAPKNKKVKTNSAGSTPSVAEEKGSSSISVPKTRTIKVNPNDLCYPAGRSAVVYSLSNSPCLAYDIALVLDQGFNTGRWTWSRLQQEVLYLETRDSRFELRSENGVFFLSRVKDPAGLAWRGEDLVPVADNNKEPLAETDDWSHIVWGLDSVLVGNHKIEGLKALKWERFSNANYV